MAITLGKSNSSHKDCAHPLTPEDLRWCERQEQKQKKNNHSRLLRKLRTYGMTLEDLVKLGTNCHICGADLPGSELRIDHDHTTGLGRAVLCHGCNAGLGFFEDSIPRLQGAINYLAYWRAIHELQALGVTQKPLWKRVF